MKKISFITGCLSLLFFSACQKELSDNFNTYNGHPLNDTVWVRDVPVTAPVHELRGLLAAEPTRDSCALIGDTTFKYSDSLEINFPYFGFTIVDAVVGVSYTGKTKLDILRLKTKGDYIRAFRPTTNNAQLLESSGAFFIGMRLSKDSMAMDAGRPFHITFSDTEDPKDGMRVIFGEESKPIPEKSIDTAFTWGKPEDNGTLTGVKIIQKQTNSGALIKGYELTSKKSRWIMCGRYVDSTKPKAKLSAILPLNFTNKNTAVFAVFANQTTVVGLKADYASRSFAAPNIPVATRLKIVTISRIGADLYLGSKEVADVGTAAAHSVNPEKKSLKDILSFLNTL